MGFVCVEMRRWVAADCREMGRWGTVCAMGEGRAQGGLTWKAHRRTAALGAGMHAAMQSLHTGALGGSARASKAP